jgi:hypothetical protein
MSWRHPTADDFDHARDLQKHEWRPGDKPCPRVELPAPSVLAIETALMVRHEGINLTLAAQLIEEFARAEAQRIRLDAVAAGANA